MERDAEKARQELVSVLSSATFRASPKLSQLLEYLVTQQKPGTLTQAVIATEFFHRASSEFDPKADTQVRTEIRRLRLKLAEYYMNEGAGAAGRLDIPKGAYEVVWRPLLTAPKLTAIAPRRRLLIPALALTLAAAVMAVALGLRSESIRTPLRSLAVIPFANSETLADDLSRRLTRSKPLRVTARNSTAGFKNRKESLAEIGRKLSVDGVVDGTVSTLSGNEISVEAKLTNLRNGREIWSRKVKGPAGDLARLEDELSNGILSALGLPAVPAQYSPKAEALNAYIQGLQSMRQPPQNMDRARQQFEEAARLDPRFAAAHVSLARVYFVGANNGHLDPLVALPKAESALRVALQADPESSEAHVALGNLHYARHAWQDARREYETAIELDHSSASAYTAVAMLLTILGRFEDAERELALAIALDPLWYGPQMMLGEVHYYEKRYDQSFADGEQCERRFPGMSVALLKARARLRQGRKTEAARYLAELPATQNAYRIIAATDPAQGMAQLRSTERAKDYTSAWVRATVAMELGYREEAIAWLEKSLSAGEPDVCSLNIDPLFDPVRGDPRCQRILAKLNLTGPK